MGLSGCGSSGVLSQQRFVARARDYLVAAMNSLVASIASFMQFLNLKLLPCMLHSIEAEGIPAFLVDLDSHRVRLKAEVPSQISPRTDL